MEQLDVRILGPLEVVLGGSLLSLGGQKQRAVLAILATRSSSAVSSDQLIELLWSGSPPATAATTVQVYVSRLRKLLGADRIETSGGGYMLRVEPDELDAARFRRLVSQGRSLDALALWRGPALADFAYESWAQAEAGRLEEERLACLEERIDADLESGRQGELVGELEALVAEHPLRERLRSQLMLALYRAGRQAEALDAYQRARSTLVEELGIEPGPELQELNRKILQQDQSLAPAAGKRRLPTGTLTLVATDIEGSTRLLSELGVDGYARALEEHRRALRDTFAVHDGVEVDQQGDAFLVVFARPQDAVAAAADAQRAHAGGPVRVRIGIHTGTPTLTEEGYVGLDVHRAARVMAAGHGGQVLVSQTTCDLLDGTIGMRDLGKHRLKDLTAPQRLYQLLIEGLPDGFPALKTLEAQPTNLPVQPSPLIGRERELAEVCSLLRRSDIRLLTLTGPSGSGKTRLGLQAAAELLGEHDSGTFFVGLAPVTEPELVLPTIAQALGLQEWPGRTISETLRDYLERKTLFLLLDNLEQVVEAAPAIADLLSSCPKLSILTTSREALRLAAEREYPVDPLWSQDALALFAERARTSKPDFTLTPDKEALVREICSRLDDLPLAIELAASRVKLLPLEALRARLDKRLSLLTKGARDAPERQRTLRAAIDWSFKLLAEDEQALFARLGVFPGSFSLEAAEAITGGDLEGIGSLLDKSLLRQAEGPASEPRFFLLETIREYANERLRASGELDDLRRRHTEHFVSFAEEVASRGRSPEERLWKARMRAERSNLRAVLARALETDDLEPSLWLVGLLWGWWEDLGWGEETRAWLDQALPRAPRPTLARCVALIEAGRLDECFGEYDRALTRYEQARRIAQKTGESKWEANALSSVGWRLAYSGRANEGRSRCEEALALARELPDELTIAGALNNLSGVLVVEGNFVGARTLQEECLAIRRRAGAQGSIANVLGNLGWVAINQGEYAEAAKFLDEGLSIAREIGDSWHAVVMLTNLAWVELLQGSAADAEALFVKALTGLEEVGRDPRACAECLLGLAGSTLELGDLGRAARLAAAGEVLVEQLGSTLAEPEARVRERVRTAVEQAAWAEGRKLTLDQALSLALGTG
jgi:predicted ATPase/DNA-binding SARP family transcriptional activator